MNIGLCMTYRQLIKLWKILVHESLTHTFSSLLCSHEVFVGLLTGFEECCVCVCVCARARTRALIPLRFESQELFAFNGKI